MTRSEIIRSLHEEYSRLREENLREHDRRLSYVEAIDPRIADIVRSSNSLFMQQARLILSRPEEAEKWLLISEKKHLSSAVSKKADCFRSALQQIILIRSIIAGCVKIEGMSVMACVKCVTV